jgi:uncharacterized repeat protein (TIGR01451 family)
MNNSISLGMIALLPLLVGMSGSAPIAFGEERADLALTKTTDRTRVRIGQNITFTIGVTNCGPGSARGVVFGDPVPDPLNLVSFSCSKGTINGASFCAVDSLAPGESVTATLVATPITNPAENEREFGNTAFIAESSTFDPNSSNDSASLNLRIISGSDATSRRETISFEHNSECTGGETVRVSGTIHFVSQTQATGSVMGHFNYQNMTGVGLASGTVYRVSAVNHLLLNAPIPSSINSVQRFHLVSQGSGSNLFLAVLFHVTVNANGEVTATIDDVRCM